MNLNEFFFFKVFPCKNNQNHDYENCYFYHKIIPSDKRRYLLNIPIFLKKYENIQSNQNNILGFNSKNNELDYYIDSMSFSNKDIDQELYENFNPCLNLTEYKYHIFNYKNRECEYYKLGFKCPLNKLCYNIHEREMDNSINKKQFDKLKEFINKVKKKGIYIYLSEIFDLFFFILDINNSYLQKNFNETIKLQYKKIKNDLQSQKKKEINTLDEDVINEISKNKNSISINDNIFKSLKLDENSIYFISLIMPKKEIITKVITSFLNSHNGYLIIGGDENSDEIKGVKLSRKKRDEFKIWINLNFINVLIEYESNLKYEFIDLDIEEMCILKINVKKIANKKLIKDKFNNEWFIISKKFLDKFEAKKLNRISQSEDIKKLNTKEYIEIVRKRFIDYYTNKFLK